MAQEGNATCLSFYYLIILVCILAVTAAQYIIAASLGAY
jgi:hypothetical protein